MDLARMRNDYETAGIDANDLGPDPIEAFQRWLQAAVDAELAEPNAMVVSTVDAGLQPWSRYVLLKQVSAAGFDFYTNYESHKSRQLDLTPKASLAFGWLPLNRQVTISGTVRRVPDNESDEYWAVRPRGSQLGSLVSRQSRPLASRQELLDQFSAAEANHDDSVDRPGHWGGWRVEPHTIEFWQGRKNRLHDRLRFSRVDEDWSAERLFP